MVAPPTTIANEPETKRSILEVLKRRGAMTVDALTENFGLSKTAMRAHLLRLEQSAMIERTTMAPDGPGRPPLAYKVTAHGGGVFPSDDNTILTRLLTFLDRQGASALIREFFDDQWAERLAELKSAVDVGDDELLSRPLETRLSALETLLSNSNFMPTVASHCSADGETRVVVRECNCPLPAAVAATKIPCQLEARFLEKVIGAPMAKMSIAAHRGEPCRFEFVLDAEK